MFWKITLLWLVAWALSAPASATAAPPGPALATGQAGYGSGDVTGAGGTSGVPAVAPVPGGTGNPPAVTVIPAKLEAEVGNGEALPPLKVVNGTAHPLFGKAYLGWGGHDPEGTPLYRDSPEDVESASIVFDIQPGRFEVPPRGTVELTVGVAQDPVVTGGLYPVIFVELSPDPFQIDPSRSPSVASVLRIAVITLLSFGGPLVQEGEVVGIDLGATDSREEPPSLVVRIRYRNTGNVHFRARGWLRVTDSDGEAVREVQVEPRTVLPGNERYFPVPLHPGELEGGGRTIVATLFTPSGHTSEYSLALSAPEVVRGADE
ncbi:MAG: hypothetical protein HYY08_02830 [Firmicutes bacterium]|nr:hypothetical protein [Bacillota bacterium]